MTGEAGGSTSAARAVNDSARTFREATQALDRGDLARAERLSRSVLGSDEAHSGALTLLAVVTMRQGRLEEAEQTIARALKFNKRDVAALSIRAMIHRSQGKIDAALETLDRTLRLDPKNLRALNNRGTLLKELGQHERAIADFDAALFLDRSYVAAIYNKAGSLAALGRHDIALALYEKIIAAAPAFPGAWIGRGLSQSDLGRLDDALASFSRAIELAPADPNGHFNLANALLASGRAEDALVAYDRAIEREPGFVDAHYNRAGALRSLRRFEAAAAAYRQTLALAPDHAQAYNNLGGALTELLEFDAAIAAFDACLALRPDDPDALYNKGVPLLLRGNYEAGWQAMEARKRQKIALGARNFRQPEWLGDRDLGGKTILVHWEQGLGDTLQFSRYVKKLELEGARVLFAPQRSMLALMKGLDADAALVDVDDASLTFDLHCPLLSLPLAFGTRLDTIPAAKSYLRADPDRVAIWRRRLGPGFKIGVDWSGSPFGASIGRAAPRALVAGLQRPGIRLISLQKAQSGAAPVQDGIEDLGLGFDAGPDAFVDAAAVIESLDLVISVDTAIGHLAGALGARTWIAMKRLPDWRWLLDRSDSPWYPATRLFRQSVRDDWTGVFADIAAALEHAAARGTRADA